MLGSRPLASLPLAAKRVILLRLAGVQFAQSFGAWASSKRVHPAGFLATRFGVVTIKRRHTLAELTAQITPNVSLQETPRVFNLAYGDGYYSDMPDGLQQMTRTLTLVWDGIAETEIDMLMDYFATTSGEVINFRPPRELTPRLWLTQQLRRTKPYPDSGALTATLIEKVL